MGVLDTLLETLTADTVGKRKTAKSDGRSLTAAQVTQFIKAAVAVVSKVGLIRLIEMFKAAGLNKEIRSWIGTGKNLPVTGEQVQSALGADIIDELAKKSGMEKPTAADALAKYLPKVIDTFTPDGRIDKKVVERETDGFDLGEMARLGSLAKLADGDVMEKAGALLDSFLKKKG